jgi:hypothetical protein
MPKARTRRAFQAKGKFLSHDNGQRFIIAIRNEKKFCFVNTAKMFHNTCQISPYGTWAFVYLETAVFTFEFPSQTSSTRGIQERFESLLGHD